MKEKKVKSSGHQLFNVPNNQEGILFRKLMHKFLNADSRVQLHSKGRGSRRLHGDRASIPIPHSEWVAVYVRPKPHVEMFERGPYEFSAKNLYRWWKDEKVCNNMLSKQVKELETKLNQAEKIESTLRNQVEANFRATETMRERLQYSEFDHRKECDNNFLLNQELRALQEEVAQLKQDKNRLMAQVLNSIPKPAIEPAIKSAIGHTELSVGESQQITITIKIGG